MLHMGRPVQLSMMSMAAQVTTLALVNTGSLVQLPDGSIAEPVEVFAVETDAHAHREQVRRDNPREDFRVIASLDVSL
jgi:hypothetical protein